MASGLIHMHRLHELGLYIVGNLALNCSMEKFCYYTIMFGEHASHFNLWICVWGYCRVITCHIHTWIQRVRHSIGLIVLEKTPQTCHYLTSSLLLSVLLG